MGERGAQLSGGERQRVAIARRNFLTGRRRDRDLLRRGELSSLDVRNPSADVQLASDALMAGRTTIVIAHRLSTIRGADRILVFNEGRIVEEGRHRDLVAMNGAYARLHAVSEGAALSEVIARQFQRGVPACASVQTTRLRRSSCRDPRRVDQLRSARAILTPQ